MENESSATISSWAATNANAEHVSAALKLKIVVGIGVLGAVRGIRRSSKCRKVDPIADNGTRILFIRSVVAKGARATLKEAQNKPTPRLSASWEAARTKTVSSSKRVHGHSCHLPKTRF